MKIFLIDIQADLQVCIGKHVKQFGPRPNGTAFGRYCTAITKGQQIY